MIDILETQLNAPHNSLTEQVILQLEQLSYDV